VGPTEARRGGVAQVTTFGTRAATNSKNYTVLEDPDGVFEGGVFPKFDFLYSLGGRVWAEGMIVVDADNRRMKVQYPIIEGHKRSMLVDIENGQQWILTHDKKLILGEHKT